MSCCFIEITTRNIKNVKKQGIGLIYWLLFHLVSSICFLHQCSLIALLQLDVSEPWNRRNIDRLFIVAIFSNRLLALIIQAKSLLQICQDSLLWWPCGAFYEHTKRKEKKPLVLNGATWLEICKSKADLTRNLDVEAVKFWKVCWGF